MFFKEKKKILLAEPDEFLAEIYKKNLVMEDFEVLWGSTRDRVLKLAESKNPKVIVTELILRDTDGFALLEDLKKNKKTKDIPVIFLTKLGGKEEVARGLAAGAQGYVIKQHFRPAELVDKIKKIMLLNEKV